MNVESSGYPNSELNLLRHEMGDSVREYPKNGEVMETPDIEPGFELDDLYDNSDNQSSPESDPTDPEQVKIIDKLRTVYEEYGFLPSSQPELTEVWEIRKYRDKPSGVAQYLNRVLHHQMRSDVNSADPKNALISKTNQWIQWRNETVGDKNAVEYMRSLASVGSLDDKDLLRDAQYARGYRVAQSTDSLVQQLAESSVKRPYSAIERHDINGLSSDELKSIVWQASLSAEARSTFWLDVLLEARKHAVVRAMAQGAIDEVIKRRRTAK